MASDPPLICVVKIWLSRHENRKLRMSLHEAILSSSFMGMSLSSFQNSVETFDLPQLATNALNLVPQEAARHCELPLRTHVTDCELHKTFDRRTRYFDIETSLV